MSLFFKLIFFVFGWGFISSNLFAEVNAASGLGISYNIRRDYGGQNFSRLGFEIPSYLYLPIIHSFYARPGVRFGYSNSQPEMPKSVQINETDLIGGIEAGVLFDWYIVPSLTFGTGMIRRTIKLSLGDKIESDSSDSVSHTETLGYWNVQVGTGFPTFDGLVLFEPFARYWRVTGDERSEWTFGLETTVQFL